MKIATKILEAIAEPIRVNEKKYLITASIGISLYPTDADNVMDLLRKSDQAMYHAKQSGKNNYKFTFQQ
jgi:diguanylate cyclase (GGDEF)-like protein